MRVSGSAFTWLDPALKKAFPILTGLLILLALFFALYGANLMPGFVVNRYADAYTSGANVLRLHLPILCIGLWAYLAVLRFPSLQDWAAKRIGSARPGDLGAIRMWVCGILLISALWEDLASTSFLPAEMRRPYGVIKVIQALPIGFEHFQNSHSLLAAWQWMTIIALFLGTIGLWTRWALPLGALGYLVLGGVLRQYSHFFHTGLVPLYLLIALTFMPCHHACSLDRVIAKRRGRRVIDEQAPQPIYAWSRYVLWVLLALTYLMAGLSKLRTSGWMWPAPENMKAIFFSGSLIPMHFDFEFSLLLRDAPDVFFLLLGITALGGELLYCLALFSKHARLVMPLAMLSMHLGIFFFQNILFFDLILLQALFLDSGKLRAWIAGKFAARSGQDAALAESAKGSEGVRPALSSVRDTTRIGVSAASFVTFLLLGSWAIGAEFYPLTSMGMFKERTTSGVVGYFKPLAHYASGEVREARFDEWIGAMADSRYRRVVGDVFGEGRETTFRFFDASIKRANAGLMHEGPRMGAGGDAMNTAAGAAENRLIGFEIQKWEWDFRNQPDSPSYGEMTDRVFYPPK